MGGSDYDFSTSGRYSSGAISGIDEVPKLTLREKSIRYAKVILPHVGLVLLLGTYTVCGAGVFHMLERPNEVRMRDRSLLRMELKRTEMVSTLWFLAMNLSDTEDNWKTTAKQMLHEQDLEMLIAFEKRYFTINDVANRTKPVWTFPAAIFFASTVITTIDETININFLQNEEEIDPSNLFFEISHFTYHRRLQEVPKGWQISELWNRMNREGSPRERIVIKAQMNGVEAPKRSEMKTPTLYSLTAQALTQRGSTNTSVHSSAESGLSQFTDANTQSAESYGSAIPISYRPSKTQHASTYAIRTRKKKRPRQVIDFSEVHVPMARVLTRRTVPVRNTHSRPTTTQSSTDPSVNQEEEILKCEESTDEVVNCHHVKEKGEIRPKVFDSHLSCTCNKDSKMSFPSMSMSTVLSEGTGDLDQPKPMSFEQSYTQFMETFEAEKRLKEIGLEIAAQVNRLEKIHEDSEESALGVKHDEDDIRNRSLDREMEEIINFKNPCRDSTMAIRTPAPSRTPSRDTTRSFTFAPESEKSRCFLWKDDEILDKNSSCDSSTLMERPFAQDNKNVESSSPSLVAAKEKAEKSVSDLEHDIIKAILLELLKNNNQQIDESSHSSAAYIQESPEVLALETLSRDKLAQMLGDLITGSGETERQEEVESQERRDAGACTSRATLMPIASTLQIVTSETNLPIHHYVMSLLDVLEEQETISGDKSPMRIFLHNRPLQHGTIRWTLYLGYFATTVFHSLGLSGKFLSDLITWVYRSYRAFKINLARKSKRIKKSSFARKFYGGETMSSVSSTTGGASDQDDINIPVWIVLLFLSSYTALGGVLFQAMEGWSYFDSFYFCFITMATVGFGDIVPTEQMFMFFTMMYIVIGLAVTTMCIDLAGTEYIRKIHYFGQKMENAKELFGESLHAGGDFVKHAGEVLNVKNIAMLRKMGVLHDLEGYGYDNEDEILERYYRTKGLSAEEVRQLRPRNILYDPISPEISKVLKPNIKIRPDEIKESDAWVLENKMYGRPTFRKMAPSTKFGLLVTTPNTSRKISRAVNYAQRRQDGHRDGSWPRPKREPTPVLIAPFILKESNV